MDELKLLQMSQVEFSYSDESTNDHSYGLEELFHSIWPSYSIYAIGSIEGKDNLQMRVWDLHKYLSIPVEDRDKRVDECLVVHDLGIPKD